MKTDALIDLLARGAGPAPRAVALRRLGPAALGGLLLAAVLAFSLIGPIPVALYATPIPWMKLAYAGAMALASGWLSARLARPAARLVVPRRTVAGVVAAMAAVGAASLIMLPEAERAAALMGHSWSTCPLSVLVLSLPALVGALWALRGLAPTRPRAAGLAAGLLAGAVGAFGYAFACEEASMAFVALWYTLGIGLAGALGAALGPRVLRW